jgi:hypothetical protein
MNVLVSSSRKYAVKCIRSKLEPAVSSEPLLEAQEAVKLLETKSTVLRDARHALYYSDSLRELALWTRGVSVRLVIDSPVDCTMASRRHIDIVGSWSCMQSNCSRVILNTTQERDPQRGSVWSPSGLLLLQPRRRRHRDRWSADSKSQERQQFQGNTGSYVLWGRRAWLT